MERRKSGNQAWCLFVYRHTRMLGYKAPCPNVHLIGTSCVLCHDTGEIGFFRAERMRRGKR